MELMTTHHTTHSAAETEALGEALAKELNPCVIAFFGDLGAGKTTFVRGLARGLAYPDRVSSPTFAIIQEYIGGRVPLYHFDMYRVEGPEDLYACGYYDYLNQGILAIEWSENIVDLLPSNAIRITMQYGADDDSRQITIERPEAQ